VEVSKAVIITKQRQWLRENHLFGVRPKKSCHRL